MEIALAGTRDPLVPLLEEKIVNYYSIDPPFVSPTSLRSTTTRVGGNPPVGASILADLSRSAYRPTQGKRINRFVIW